MPKSEARSRRPVKRDEFLSIKRRTRPLWPDVGQELGLGKNGTYAAAARGEIAGARRIGSRWFVFSEQYERDVTGE